LKLGPGSVAFGGNIRGHLGADEKEIVLDDFIEMAGGQLGGTADEGAVGWIGIAE
jgi:hypothetical protein